MNIQLLQWGLFSFMLGLILSLPLAAVFYQKSPQWTKIFTNPRKLKSAHLDFFMQAFAIGFVYVLELAMEAEFPIYVVIPLIFGTIGNPLIFLLEATPLHRSGIGSVFYRLLKTTSPASLLFAWLVIAWYILPGFMKLLLLAFVLLGLFFIFNYQRREIKPTESSIRS
ncbi:hypothetical protein [Ammoniphilus sp. 3BR4]|uniref:hypothetical protein n=1 Tax=Ammoniphilus sp. 3BR4 TaxID=3158265 RepID=UPI003465A7D6